MELTQHNVARANQRNRARLAVALGLPKTATIADITRAANEHHARQYMTPRSRPEKTR